MQCSVWRQMAASHLGGNASLGQKAAEKRDDLPLGCDGMVTFVWMSRRDVAPKRILKGLNSEEILIQTPVSSFWGKGFISR